MRFPKIREVIEAVKSLILPPYTSKFPKILPEVPDGFRGKPEYDEEKCIVCGACHFVCPSGCIEIIETKYTRKMIQNLGACLFCGMCEKKCTTGEGIKLTKIYDTATFNCEEAITTSEDKLVFCEQCGEKITTEKHLKWIAKKVGPLLVSNPTLYLMAYKDLGLAAELSGEKSPDRSDNIKILCPKCRREMVFTEVWG